MSLPIDNLLLTSSRFIRDTKVPNKDFKLTKDSKSHKKTLKDRITKRITEKKKTEKKKTEKQDDEPQEYSIPVTKTRKNVQLKKRCKVIRENLFDCVDDTENGFYDAETELACTSFDDAAALKIGNDMVLTYDEYQAQCDKNNKLWEVYKKLGLTREMFDESMEYESNLDILRRYNQSIDYDPEYYQELCEKVVVYQTNLEKQVEIEEDRIINWFANYAENNLTIFEKIQERNNAFAVTVFEAMQ